MTSPAGCDNLGPVAQARAALAAAGGWTALHDELAELFARFTTAGGGIVTFPAEYLLVTGRKAG